MGTRTKRNQVPRGNPNKKSAYFYALPSPPDSKGDTAFFRLIVQILELADFALQVRLMNLFFDHRLDDLAFRILLHRDFLVIAG